MEEKIDYDFGTEGEETDLRKLSEVAVDTLRMDYGAEHPISFLMVNSVEEGVDWFERNHPEYPEYLIDVLAEFNWGKWRTERPPPPPDFTFKKDVKEVTVDFN